MQKEKHYSKKSYFITHGAVLAVLLIICILANVLTAKWDSVLTDYFGTVGGTKTTAQAGDFVSEFKDEEALRAAQLGDAQLVGLGAEPDLRQEEGGLYPGNHLAEELRGAPAHTVRPQGAPGVGIGKNHPPPLHEDGALSGHLEYLQCRFKHVSPPS